MRHGMMGCLAALALGYGGVAAAHHSFAMFDQSKNLPLKGTVHDFQWTNPHAFIDVDVPNAPAARICGRWNSTAPITSSARAGSPSQMKPGDKVTVVINPLRDGSKGGLFVAVTLPTARSWAIRRARGGGPINVPQTQPTAGRARSALGFRGLGTTRFQGAGSVIGAARAARRHHRCPAAAPGLAATANACRTLPTATCRPWSRTIPRGRRWRAPCASPRTARTWAPRTACGRRPRPIRNSGCTSSIRSKGRRLHRPAEGKRFAGAGRAAPEGGQRPDHRSRDASSRAIPPFAKAGWLCGARTRSC